MTVKPITDAPKDGSIFYTTTYQPTKWTPYKANSQQRKHGKLGRWQVMNEYGGWENMREGFETFVSELPDADKTADRLLQLEEALELLKPRPISEAPKEVDLLLFCDGLDAAIVASYEENPKSPEHVWQTLDGDAYHKDWPGSFVEIEAFERARVALSGEPE